MKKLILPLIFVLGIGCSKDEIKPVDGKWTFQSQLLSMNCSFTIASSGGNYTFSNVMVNDGFYPATMQYSNKNVVLRTQESGNTWMEFDMEYSYNGNNIIMKNVLKKRFHTSDWTNGSSVDVDSKVIANRVN